MVHWNVATSPASNLFFAKRKGNPKEKCSLRIDLSIVSKKIKILLNFFQKIVGFQRAKPLVARRNERNQLV